MACNSHSDGYTDWSTRKRGEALSVSHMMIARVWRKHALKPLSMYLTHRWTLS